MRKLKTTLNEYCVLLPYDILCLVESFFVFDDSQVFCIHNNSKGTDDPKRTHFAAFHDVYWMGTHTEYPMYELLTELDFFKKHWCDL